MGVYNLTRETFSKLLNINNLRFYIEKIRAWKYGNFTLSQIRNLEPNMNIKLSNLVTSESKSVRQMIFDALNLKTPEVQ
jgi:hypothetical protein